MALTKYQTILRIELNNGIGYSRHQLMVPGNFYPRVAGSFKADLIHHQVILAAVTQLLYSSLKKTHIFAASGFHKIANIHVCTCIIYCACAHTLLENYSYKQCFPRLNTSVGLVTKQFEEKANNIFAASGFHKIANIHVYIHNLLAICAYVTGK